MSNTETIDHSKRRLFTRWRAAATSSSAPKTLASETLSRQAARPPFAVDESLFLRLCDGCGLCASACPSQIITMENGVAAIDISYAACDLCGRCQQACPTLALAEQTAHTGLVATIANSCENMYGFCDSCESSCPYSALVWQEDAKPRIDTALCKGCGQCAQSCYNSMISFQLMT